MIKKLKCYFWTNHRQRDRNVFYGTPLNELKIKLTAFSNCKQHQLFIIPHLNHLAIRVRIKKFEPPLNDFFFYIVSPEQYTTLHKGVVPGSNQ